MVKKVSSNWEVNVGIQNRDELVEHPTFLENIRYFFDPIDIEHMQSVNKIDLATYEGVKLNATKIYFQTSGGSMPPPQDPARRWPENRVKSFRNWIVDKFPVGVSPLNLAALSLAPASAVQVRRNAANLDKAEIAQLSAAFKTIMERDPSHPQSYFAIAGIHWFPSVPVTCMHHEPRYNPWHRIYVDRFEDALRSVPGCESIKLPYWDILAPVPEWLFEAPFDSYTLQAEAAPQYPVGFKTERNPPSQIADGLALYDVASDIKEALNSPDFEKFTSFIESAHDGGHVSVGRAMGRPDVAAFDPIFWFFHCNWERLFWTWQRRYSATTLEEFRSTVTSTDFSWLDTPPFNSLDPFGKTTPETIATTAYAYEEATAPLPFQDFAIVKSGNVLIDRAFRLNIEPKLSVRVKAIERLRIAGTFVVHLIADQQSVARRAFFQAEEPQKCPNCLQRAKVNIDFIVDRSAIQGKRLEVRIETLAVDRIDPWVPLSQVGSPTINIRELLISE